MKEENAKKFLLILLILVILGGAIWAVISNTYSPIKKLRSNTSSESNSYKDVSNENNNETNKSANENNSSSIDNIININNEMKNLKEEVEIAKYSTTIYDTEEPRIHNITLATQKLDGAIVEAGQEFSFNDTIGPMGEQQGYQKATGFDGNGKKIKIPGGGMCQISSTLYNAALIAGFEITERHAHSRRVYYVPQDKDASVSYDTADLKFINNKPNSVKISAFTDGHDVTITLLEIK